jgi:hypothetical protein
MSSPIAPGIAQPSKRDAFWRWFLVSFVFGISCFGYPAYCWLNVVVAEEFTSFDNPLCLIVYLFLSKVLAIPIALLAVWAGKLLRATSIFWLMASFLFAVLITPLPVFVLIAGPPHFLSSLIIPFLLLSSSIPVILIGQIVYWLLAHCWETKGKHRL